MEAAAPRSSVETLRWRDARLEMVDQRVLPAEMVYRDYASAAGVAEGIRSMVARGRRQSVARPRTALITERGVVSSPNRSNIAALLKSANACVD